VVCAPRSRRLLGRRRGSHRRGRPHLPSSQGTREREAEWRKEKLGYYKTFTESLSGIIGGDATPDGHRAFAQATNNLLLLAPQRVVEAVTAFRQEIRVSNLRRSGEAHDRLLAAMFLAIRRDVGIVPRDDAATFRPKLWASGSLKENQDQQPAA